MTAAILLNCICQYARCSKLGKVFSSSRNCSSTSTFDVLYMLIPIAMIDSWKMKDLYIITVFQKYITYPKVNTLFFFIIVLILGLNILPTQPHSQTSLTQMESTEHCHKTSKTIYCLHFFSQEQKSNKCTCACACTHARAHAHTHTHTDVTIFLKPTQTGMSSGFFFFFFLLPFKSFSTLLLFLSHFVFCLFLFFFNFQPSILSSFNKYTADVYVHRTVLGAKRNKQK